MFVFRIYAMYPAYPARRGRISAEADPAYPVNCLLQDFAHASSSLRLYVFAFNPDIRAQEYCVGQSELLHYVRE